MNDVKRLLKLQERLDALIQEAVSNLTIAEYKYLAEAGYLDPKEATREVSSKLNTGIKYAAMGAAIAGGGMLARELVDKVKRKRWIKHGCDDIMDPDERRICFGYLRNIQVAQNRVIAAQKHEDD